MAMAAKPTKSATTDIHSITTAASTTATSKPTTKAQKLCLQKVNNQLLRTNTCFVKTCLRYHF
eukprot:10520543-Ditylum_brightwellii.AAC.1